uniref:Uncharacterized protein n=1 Tax=Triticum urartu TaxID=4572 RepID=A0A8R7TYV0_TRIUA
MIDGHSHSCKSQHSMLQYTSKLLLLQTTDTFIIETCERIIGVHRITFKKLLGLH